MTVFERKSSHLALCVEEDVEHRGDTLLSEVQLVHDALPDLALDEIDLETEILGRRLAAPILISGMTGGTEEAGRVNRGLAAVAQKCGLGIGVGSQRAMLERPSAAATYRLRDVAPSALVLANLGAVQARDAGPARVAELVDAIEADALCVHLNVAQELVQAEGDRDFRGCIDAIAALAATLRVPVVAKETGCGLGPSTLGRLRDAGIAWVDVSGAGGTSWTAVESLRGPAAQRALGETLREWGIPTAVSVAWAREAGLHTIASGGLRTGLDAARALALGADAVSLALPFLRAFAAGGEDAALAAAQDLVAGLRAVTLLTGSRSVEALRSAPRSLGPRLRAWLDRHGPV